jgi:hypothetical protein
MKLYGIGSKVRVTSALSFGSNVKVGMTAIITKLESGDSVVLEFTIGGKTFKQWGRMNTNVELANDLKDLLVAGYVVELRDGSRGLTVLDGNIAFDDYTWIDSKGYNDDLTRSSNSAYDIVKIGKLKFVANVFKKVGLKDDITWTWERTNVCKCCGQEVAQ